jgi:hypothetical protein
MKKHLGVATAGADDPRPRAGALVYLKGLFEVLFGFRPPL